MSEACVCPQGVARLTGATMMQGAVTMYQYECCAAESAYLYGLRLDGEACGDYLAPPPLPPPPGACSQEDCRSPGVDDEPDCWAGTANEQCSCSQGEARLTGKTYYMDSEGTTYYEYTCCIGGSNTGPGCGDFSGTATSPPSSNCPDPCNFNCPVFEDLEALCQLWLDRGCACCPAPSLHAL